MLRARLSSFAIIFVATLMALALTGLTGSAFVTAAMFAHQTDPNPPCRLP